MFNEQIDMGEGNSECLFIKSALLNIEFGLIALKHILNQQYYDKTIYGSRHSYYFFHIQSLLSACGNIWNIFYCHTDQSSTQRSRGLRYTFGIDKAKFPLIFQKEVRNTSMHFDEWFDQWNGKNGDYNLLEASTPLSMREEILNTPHLRTLDLSNNIYYTYRRRSNRGVQFVEQIQYDLNILCNELLLMRNVLTVIKF